jgi:hypothetical protein
MSKGRCQNVFHERLSRSKMSIGAKQRSDIKFWTSLSSGRGNEGEGSKSQQPHGVVAADDDEFGVV